MVYLSAPVSTQDHALFVSEPMHTGCVANIMHREKSNIPNSHKPTGSHCPSKVCSSISLHILSCDKPSPFLLWHFTDRTALQILLRSRLILLAYSQKESEMHSHPSLSTLRHSSPRTCPARTEARPDPECIEHM